MGTERIAGTGSLARALIALMVTALAAAALTGSGPAAAAARPGGPKAPTARLAAAAGTISTVAGGVGGPAKGTKVALAGPCGVRFAAGRLYIAGSNGRYKFGGFGAVREVNPRTGQLTTPAGTSAPGVLGDGGLATRANLSTCGVAVDHAGNLVIADLANNRIRVAAASTGTFYGLHMTAGDIYTIAGNGTAGFSGDGGPATNAEFNSPESVAIDAAGNLVITDTFNDRIRVAAASTGTFYGQHMTAGDIYTIAGTGSFGFSGDGGPATSAELSEVSGVAIDAAGNVVIADTLNDRIRVVAASSGTFYGQAMTAEDIYTVAGGGTGGLGDGGPATSAELNQPLGVTVDATGNLVIADTNDHRIRVAAASSGTFYGQAMTAEDIYTVAGNGRPGDSGDGGLATRAEFSDPESVAVDAGGNVVIADFHGGFRVRVVAASTGTFYGRAMTAGHIYTAAGNGTEGFSGDRGPATEAELNSPQELAVDAAGNQLIADTANNAIRVVAASTGIFYRQAMTARHIYTVAGNGMHGFSGDGGPATSAELRRPEGVAVDSAGNLVISDQLNYRIRVVAASTGTFYGQAMTARDIYTVAGNGSPGFSGDGGPATSAELNDPDGVAVDSTGNLVIADTVNNRIRVIAASTGTFYGQAMTAGNIYTVAGNGLRGFSGDGGPATSAELNLPDAVTMSPAGNLLIADTVNNRIRVIAASTGTFYGQKMKTGHIYTVVGGGTGGLGDGGPATSAELAGPDAVATSPAGNLLIGDPGDSRVRVVAQHTGTFYGKNMTAGDIYTVAGNGDCGFSGDGGPATSAELCGPEGVATSRAGNLLISDGGIDDGGSNRIRMVTG
jgi:sugar lactone lactonase YvrE